ncbi:MAG TPA: heme o synthase [Chthonomonadaceae bacterium]|nr:heme o synthase [Chthonomonadaceae bacterium]
MNRTRFQYGAWSLLIYNVGVSLWGAYVRATGSGAGCGNHWPLCNGEVVPRPEQIKTLIEFTHRLSVGLAILLAAWLAVWAFRAYPKGHPVRAGIKLILLFTFTESLIGAGLVLYKLVEHNASAYRAVAISAHLINTFLLLASLTLTALWSSGVRGLRLRGQGAVLWALGLGLLGALVLGVSGAVTALGDTLFPSSSVIEGLRQDFSPTAHFLVRLRPLHPLIAMSVGLYLLLIAGLVSYLRPSPLTRRFARGIGALFLVEISLGLLNVKLLAPVWMQLVHLLFAYLLWINLVLVAATALAEDVPQVEIGGGEPVPDEAVSHHAGAGVASWKDYLALTKPRVISLLLFTTLTAMFIAGRPGLWLLLAVAVGGYMAAGAANAINMVIDRDIDGRMQRTARRPTVTQNISSRSALCFAFALAVGSFTLLWGAANLLAAMLALAGLVFYVIIYTLVLKRRTWHNIVIGGAAGSFPPLVGYAAVTGHLSPLAWYLFAIIFVWTPVHFWALALLIKDDYARAGIPMLPVVLGERITVMQIGLYAILTAVISVLPLAQGEVHWLYFGAAVLLNAVLLLRSLQLYQQPDRPHAVALFHYSMVYLALLFLMMAVDRRLWL